MGFSKHKFDKYLIDKGVIGFFSEGKILKSGRLAYWYANCRDIATEDSDITADFVISYLEYCGLDYFSYVYGVPRGASTLATIVNHKLRKPPVDGRDAPKSHGDTADKYFVGSVKEGDRVIVLEDVTTTGGSVLQTIDHLEEFGVKVVAVVALVNRMERRDDSKTVAQCVRGRGIMYYAMSTAERLLPLAIAKERPDADFLSKLRESIAKVSVLNHPIMWNAKARDKLCLPLDGLYTMDAVYRRLSVLGPFVGIFKIGKELFTRFGPDVVHAVMDNGNEVFLDLKYHDIPNTVHGAAEAAADMGVSMFNVHALGGLDMMRAAVQGARGSSISSPKVLAVTILTSIDEERFKEELGFDTTIQSHVYHLARLAEQAGCDGVVCSAKDLPALRSNFSEDFMLVTPGIAGPNTTAGSDQKRVATPYEAVRDGADILVVGRAITGAEDQKKAAIEVLEDIARY